MEERSRQQCTIRYRRALDTDIRFGRWDASEDVVSKRMHFQSLIPVFLFPNFLFIFLNFFFLQ